MDLIKIVFSFNGFAKFWKSFITIWRS